MSWRILVSYRRQQRMAHLPWEKSNFQCVFHPSSSSAPIFLLLLLVVIVVALLLVGGSYYSSSSFIPPPSPCHHHFFPLLFLCLLLVISSSPHFASILCPLSAFLLLSSRSIAPFRPIESTSPTTVHCALYVHCVYLTNHCAVHSAQCALWFNSVHQYSTVHWIYIFGSALQCYIVHCVLWTV